VSQEYLLGVLFSYFLFIGNLCGVFYLKIDVWILKKTLYRKIFKTGIRFYPSPFIFSPGMPINTEDLRMKGKIHPFITLHCPSSFLPFFALY